MTGPSQLSALVPRIAGVLAQPANLAIVAGLVVGIAGGTVLVGTSKPSAGETPPAANLALFACPGSGAELTSVPVGTSLLVTARSTDGQWLEAYLGEPGVEYAWAPAADVRLASPPDALPAADCTSATTAQASATPTATIVAVVTATPAATASATASPVAGPTPSATESPAIAPTPTPTLPPTAVPTHTASPTASPTPTPKPTASPTPKPTASPTPKPTPTPTPKPTATPTPTPTPTPSDTTAPTLSNLIVNPATKIQCISPNDKAVIQVTATDPDDPVSSVTIGVTPPWNQAPYLADMNKVVGSNNWTYTIDSGTGGSDSQVKYTVTAHDSHGNSKSLSASSNSADPSYLGYASNGCIF